MSVEIERKYLVNGSGWKTVKPIDIRQGYLNTDQSRTVRVRVAGVAAYLTIKGKTTNLSRPEFEYEIPLEDARELLLLCSDAIIEKSRYLVPFGGLIWEVDEFYGANAGLVIAEVELQAEDQSVVKPDWVAEEVSGDARYYNASLVKSPFTSWVQDS